MLASASALSLVDMPPRCIALPAKSAERCSMTTLLEGAAIALLAIQPAPKDHRALYGHVSVVGASSVRAGPPMPTALRHADAPPAFFPVRTVANSFALCQLWR